MSAKGKLSCKYENRSSRKDQISQTLESKIPTQGKAWHWQAVKLLLMIISLCFLDFTRKEVDRNLQERIHFFPYSLGSVIKSFLTFFLQDSSSMCCCLCLFAFFPPLLTNFAMHFKIYIDCKYKNHCGCYIPVLSSKSCSQYGIGEGSYCNTQQEKVNGEKEYFFAKVLNQSVNSPTY